jgi:hypothetical protein
VAHIVEEGFEPKQRVGLSGLLLDERGVSEAAPRSGSSLVR